MIEKTLKIITVSNKSDNYIGGFTILLDPPYNDKYATKYAKISNIEKEKEFVIFANTPKTTELFNHIIRLNPKIIIIKCWQYYILKG